MNLKIEVKKIHFLFNFKNFKCKTFIFRILKYYKIEKFRKVKLPFTGKNSW